MKAPTEPGFYWARTSSISDWRVVEVERGLYGLFFYVLGSEETTSVSYIDELGEWGDPIIRNPYPERPKQSVELEKLSDSLCYYGHITQEEAEIINEAIIFMDSLGPMLKLEQRIPKDTIP